MKLEPNWSVQNLYLTKGKALIATPLQLTIAPDALLEGWGHTVQAKDRRLLDLSGKKKKSYHQPSQLEKKFESKFCRRYLPVRRHFGGKNLVVYFF